MQEIVKKIKNFVKIRYFPWKARKMKIFNILGDLILRFTIVLAQI